MSVISAIEAFRALSAKYDTYILSTSPWNNPSASSDKVSWVHHYLGDQPDSPAYKRLILSHHKNLNVGDILIDDRTARGADHFDGELILFGSERWPNWDTVSRDLLNRAF